MNKNDLKRKLDLLDVYHKLYSLEGELLPDRMILYNSYNDDWIVFYMDERGNRSDEKVFQSEDAACQYLEQFFEEQKRDFGDLNSPKTKEQILELQKKGLEMQKLQNKEKL